MREEVNPEMTGRRSFLTFLGLTALANRVSATPLSAKLPPVPAPKPESAHARASRSYDNRLIRVAHPRPILADHPEFVHPLNEALRLRSPVLVDDPDADLTVWSWRYSYNARAIVEIPNRLNSKATAIIVVHPWGTDDGQGWRVPEPAGDADFGSPEKNSIYLRHVEAALNPFLEKFRSLVALVGYSLPGSEDELRKKLYRSIRGRPTRAEQLQGQKELKTKLRDFTYRGKPIVPRISLSSESPVRDYFRQFPGDDGSVRYDGPGFWQLPIPIVNRIKRAESDYVFYDADGYPFLREFLKRQKISNILLAGYATEQCYHLTTAGYRNLEKDFNVFLVGDATLADFPASESPQFTTASTLAFASVDHLITQTSWIKLGIESGLALA